MTVKITVDLAKVKVQRLDYDWLMIILNSTRYEKHSWSKDYKDEKGNYVAIKCNCGCYHRVLYGDEIKILWEENVEYCDFQEKIKKPEHKNEMVPSGAW